MDKLVLVAHLLARRDQAQWCATEHRRRMSGARDEKAAVDLSTSAAWHEGHVSAFNQLLLRLDDPSVLW